MKRFLLHALTVVSLCCCLVAPQVMADVSPAAQKSFRQLLKSKRPLGSGIHFAPSGLSHSKNISGQGEYAGTPDPAKAASHYGDIYGYMSYCDTPGFTPGVYAIKRDTIQKLWDDPLYTSKGYRLSTGWYKDEKVCGYATEHAFGQLIGVYYVEIDLASGSLDRCDELDPTKGYFSIATYNTADSCIYGYGINSSSDVVWMKAPASAPGNVQTICKVSVDVDICYSLCYQPLGDNFYGMTVAQQFVVIEKDGSVFTIREIPDSDKLATYRSGLVYSPFDQQYLWNAISRGGESMLYEIDLGGYMGCVETFPHGEEFDFLFTTDLPLSPGQPDKPLLIEISFEGNSLEGRGVYQMPLFAGNQEVIEKELEWTAMTDGYITDSGIALPGENVTAEYSCATSGSHRFEFYVSLDSIESQHVTTTLYVGDDVPKAPANVVLTSTLVSWDPVTEGEHGGYIDTSGLYYIVYVDGFLKGYATEGKTSLDIQLDGGSYSLHQAKVVASCKSVKSEPGLSNKLASGAPLTLPVCIAPTSDQFELLTINDANGDGATWSFNADDSSLEAPYSIVLPMDDWAFLPPVCLTATDRYYTFSLTANRRANRYSEEYIEVVAFRDTPSPDGTGIEVISRFRPVFEKQRYTGVFEVPEPGTYYIGIHCVSDADMYGVQVRDILLADNNVTKSSPAAVSSLTATGATEGRLSADIAFTLPLLTIEGVPLAADAGLTATVEGADVVTVSGKPGETLSCTVPTRQGVNSINVYVSLGGFNSIPSSVEVFTGVDKPSTVENFKMEVSDDMLTVSLSWTPPSSSLDGGYFDPAKVEYEVMVPVQQIFGITWETIYHCGTSCQASITLAAGTPMDIMEFGVLASNAAGDCGTLISASALMGTPHALPIEEDFEDIDQPMMFEPWLIYDTGSDVEFGVISVAELGIGSPKGERVLSGFCSGEKGLGIIGLPRFSTDGVDGAHVDLMLYCSPATPEVTILAQKNGQATPEAIHVCNTSGQGFREISFNIPDGYIGQKWVQLYLQCDFRSLDEVLLLDYVDILTGHSSVGSVNVEKPQATVKIEGHTIVVTDYAPGDVTVYAPDGRAIATGILSDGQSRIDVAPGIYIVRTPSTSAKVIVL